MDVLSFVCIVALTGRMIYLESRIEKLEADLPKHD